MRDERGMVLFVCLTLLSVLVALALGAFASVQNDFKITSNLRAATAALYLADAGIEWAKEQIARIDTHPPVFQDRRHSAFSGSFAVYFSAPSKVTPLTAQVDIRSVGKVRSASQLIQAGVVKDYDLADAALALRGFLRGVRFEGDSFFISGKDHDPATSMHMPQSKPRPSVSVSSPALALEIGRSLGAAQIDNIVGLKGARGLAETDRMPMDMVERLAADLCGTPTALNMPVPATGLRLTDQLWGHRLAPELRCLNGIAGGSETVTVAGNVNGAGILIIKDAGLTLSGSFRWEGLIVVSGANVGFAVGGEQNKEILGALLVNETTSNTLGVSPVLDFAGAVRIVYSRAALATASKRIPATVLAGIYSALPYTIEQIYWRAAGP
jgi:hypothetical protein